MAQIIINEKTHNLPDQSPIAEVCEKAGVPFNCNSGLCGSCQIQILDGGENLNDLSEEEKALGLDGTFRLACQCVLLQGTLKVKF